MHGCIYTKFLIILKIKADNINMKIIIIKDFMNSIKRYQHTKKSENIH